MPCRPGIRWRSGWDFMARLAEDAARGRRTRWVRSASPNPACVKQAVEARTAPLAATGIGETRHGAMASPCCSMVARRVDPGAGAGGQGEPARPRGRRNRSRGGRLPPRRRGNDRCGQSRSMWRRRCRSISPASPRRCRRPICVCFRNAGCVPVAARRPWPAWSPGPARRKARATCIARSAPPPGITSVPCASPAASRARWR